jgi:hypothetical protein
MKISDEQFSVISKMRDSGQFDECDTVTQSKLNGEVYVRWPEINGITKTVAIARCGTVTEHSHKKAN